MLLFGAHSPAISTNQCDEGTSLANRGLVCFIKITSAQTSLQDATASDVKWWLSCTACCSRSPQIGLPFSSWLGASAQVADLSGCRSSASSCSTVSDASSLPQKPSASHALALIDPSAKAAHMERLGDTAVPSLTHYGGFLKLGSLQIVGLQWKRTPMSGNLHIGYGSKLDVPHS